MTWYVLHDAAGELVGYGTSVAAVIPDGITQYQHEGERLDQAFRWNTATRAFDVPRPGPRRLIDTRDFMLRLTLPQRIAIRASSDPIVIDARELLLSGPTVDLDSPVLHQALDYLIAAGLLVSKAELVA